MSMTPTEPSNNNGKAILEAVAQLATLSPQAQAIRHAKHELAIRQLERKAGLRD